MPMNCQESRANLIEFVRSAAAGSPRDAALAGHLQVCADCARFVDEQLTLHSALASLAAQTASAPAPENLEARLLSEFDAASRARPRPVHRWFLATAAALAAAMVGALLIHHPVPVPNSAEAPAADRPFVQIPYVTPRAPYERAEVMRMNVPLTALIAAGFEVHTAEVGAAVSADVLVGQDGRALAIRLVPSSISNPDRRLNQ
jgi:hypothetical protein